MGIGITKNQLGQVLGKISNGQTDTAGAWQLLASFGDVYAAQAYTVITQPTSFYGIAVRDHWANTGADFSQFNTVALQHVRQYVDMIGKAKGQSEQPQDSGSLTVGKGDQAAALSSDGQLLLPKTAPIEESYSVAVTAAGLPPQAAIDLVINKSFTAGVEWYGHTPFGLGLESSRVSTFQNVPPGLSNADALGLLAKTATNMLYSLAQKDILPTGMTVTDFLVQMEGLGMQFNGGNAITIETQGGFNYYFNNVTGTAAMIDKAGNGTAIYKGQQINVSPDNFKPNGNGGFDIRLQGGAWTGAGLDKSSLDGSFAAIEQPNGDINAKAISGGQLLASLVGGAEGELSYTETVYRNTSSSSGLASIVNERGGVEHTTIFDGNANAAPSGTVVGENQFYVDPKYDTLNTISAATGVSVSTLFGLNSGLGVSTADQMIAPGKVVNLPGAKNLIDISTNPNPQPQSQIQNENQLTHDAANGYVAVSPTSSISFADGTLNKTDFASAQMGSLASGGVRPGEMQVDPNARPNDYLSQFHIDPSISRDANAGLINAATLNGLAASTTVNTYVDPILLDLSGNGVHMTAINDGVLFDTDHSGTLKRTGWADRKTGMLVVDDGSGQIKDVSQMFSEYYAGVAGSNGAPGQARFKDGFAALASEDKNHDGVIDQNDPIWSKLKVWVNANHDGKVGAGELKTLAELGITSINVGATAAPIGETRDGNEVLTHGSFTINGKTQEALAVDFLGDPVGSTFATDGTGTKVTSATGTTTTTAYTSSSTANETLDAGKLGVNNVYAGSGNDTLIAAPGGSWLVGGGGSNTYVGGAGDDVFVISAKDKTENIHGNGGRDTAIIVGDQGVTLNMAQAGLTIAEGGRGDDVIMSGGRSSVFIKGGLGNDTLIGGAGNDVIVGGSGHNTIIGGTGKAVIYAGTSGDTIYGAAGGSIIHAGGGADHIYGGAGNDVIEVGHGNAVIDGGGGINVVTLHGNHGDYIITKTTDGYQVSDKVANRDGQVTLKNIQKLNFSDISAVDLTLPNPMPVSDTVSTDQNGKPFDHTQAHLISAAALLANDQRLNSQGALHISNVGDALGGSVSLTQSGDVLFTPDATYTGLMSFKYGVADAAGNQSATVVDLASGQTAPMRATVTLMTPEAPSDPLLSQEWYLSDTDVLPVWQDYTGRGVRIGQFEPGGQFATGPEIFDIHHASLAPNVDPAWLATQQANGTLPTLVSNHATMVAGVMVAANNGVGNVGVAYDAKLGAYYLANNGLDLSGLGHMVSYDVANNSWGFEHDFALSNTQNQQIDTASSLIANAQYAADSGRGGLGTVIVAAGGNARATGGSAQGSLTNNNRFSIEVGAINAQSDLSTLQIGSAPFSNPGASLLVSAPGSNIQSTSHAVETDRGSLFGNNYSTMQGTSFATPIVSGIVALMLQANPNLGYRDVQEILALSARKINDPATQWSDNGAHNWNGGGMHTSNDYGFGEVDARAAVRMAEAWLTQSTGANEAVYSASSGTLGQTVAAGSTFSSTLAMNPGLNVEHAEIDVEAFVLRLGDMVVKLVSPDGTQSVLLNRAGKIPDGLAGSSASDIGCTQSGIFKYTFMSTHDWGESSGGNWTLQVTDAATGMPVKLSSWSLRLYGSKASADHTYFYTDEYKQSVLANPNRDILDAASGGRNTLNAAAVSGDSIINLASGVATLGGTALTLHNPGAIQNLIGGDGNDTLTAGAADSLLDGGRGQNTLVGGAGKDFFVVHRRTAGTDTIVNFNAARGETIDLVGFTGKQFHDLVLTQQGADVKVDLGGAQSIVLRNQNVAAIGAGQFMFQDTLVAPSAYVSSDASAATPVGTGTVTLAGGAEGVSFSSNAAGQLVASLAGTVYSHDSASSDVFVVQKQSGVSSYRNALRGFKHGIDKIDLRQVGISSFSDLSIAQENRATINGLSQIHGVSILSTQLGSANKPLELAYLDSLDPSQLSAADFLFATPTPGSAGVVTTPPTTPSVPVSTQPGTITPVVVPPVVVPPVVVPPVVVPPVVVPPITGSPVTPITGSPVTPITGSPVTPITGSPVTPITGSPVTPITGPLPFPGFPPMPAVQGHATSYQMIAAGQAWSDSALASLFSVATPNTALAYTATLGNGDPLPSWLTLDAGKSTLSGTPANTAIGTVDLKVTAATSGGVTASSNLELQIEPNLVSVGTFQSLTVQDDQIGIDASNAFTKVTAASGHHVLLESGALSSASLLGKMNNTATVTGSSDTLVMGDGDNTIRMLGSMGVVTSGNGNNTVTVTDSSAKVTLGNGNNTVSGNMNTVTVGSGKNAIISTGANATVNLGDGTNTVTASGAIDTVHLGHGVDTVEFQGALGSLAFGKDVASGSLWFQHTGQDLQISVAGSKQLATLKNWYANAAEQPYRIVAGDGKTLSNSNVEKLVQAMAAFAPTGAGATTFTPAEQQVLQPVLAANWH